MLSQTVMLQFPKCTVTGSESDSSCSISYLFQILITGITTELLLNMARCVLVTLSACLLAIALTDAARDFSFWGSLRIDCGVSVWSEWGPTNSSGYRNHTRTILRRPQNGGASCPPLTETDWGMFNFILYFFEEDF